MDKELGAGREVIVDDIVQQRDVNAARSHVCHDEDVHLARPEFATVNATSSLQAEKFTSGCKPIEQLPGHSILRLLHCGACLMRECQPDPFGRTRRHS